MELKDIDSDIDFGANNHGNKVAYSRSIDRKVYDDRGEYRDPDSGRRFNVKAVTIIGKGKLVKYVTVGDDAKAIIEKYNGFVTIIPIADIRFISNHQYHSLDIDDRA